LCKEQLILSKLQNGIAQEAKLELLTKFGEDRFGDGANFWKDTIKKKNDTRRNRIMDEFNALLDALRVEIWGKSKGENKEINQLREKIRETSICH
jgi:hypothetical protein